MCGFKSKKIYPSLSYFYDFSRNLMVSIFKLPYKFIQR